MSLRPQLTFDYAGHTAEEPLTHAPDGWDEQMVKYVRNKKYYGLFRSFTIPLKFVKDGALKLRKDFYTYGLDAVATLTINLLNPETDTYSVAFTGKFDFSTFKDNETFVEINLVDGGLAKLIKDNEGVEYEVIISGPPVADLLNIYWDAGVTEYFFGIQLLQFTTALLDLMTDGKVTDGTYAIESDLLSNTLHNFLGLTTGYQVRNSSINSDRIGTYKTTFKDFFKSLDAIMPIGIGVETRDNVETLILEERQYFFDRSPFQSIINLGDVSNFELSVYKDFNFSVVKTGYPEKDYDDDAYSLNEFNVEVELLAPNPTSSDDYEIRSKYRADGQGIQQILDNSAGTAWDQDGSDEDIFWCKIRTVPTAPSTIQMSPGNLRKKNDPLVLFSVFNAWLSPKRCLLRHQLFIESCMYGIINLDLVYTSGGKDQINNETQAIQIGALIGADWEEEHSGFTINSDIYAGQYLDPFEIRFDAPYPHNMIALVEQNPRATITFAYKGEYYTGYILELEMKLTGRDTQSIKLLSTNTNFLERLIR